MQMVRPGWRTVAGPDHRELKIGTLRSILRATGVSVDRFVELLRG